jgi:type IV secretory pathway TraG/TraD family ATPase VirD4
MDEFAQLGDLRIVKDAMALAAGYGVRLFPILQDLTQLKENFGDSWETFLANSAAQLYFAPREITSAEYISKLSGEKEVNVPSESAGEVSAGQVKQGFTGLSISWNRQVVPELRPQDVMRLPENNFLRFSKGRVHPELRKPYHCAIKGPHALDQTCSEFHGLYDPDPYHRPKKPRA